MPKQTGPRVLNRRNYGGRTGKIPAGAVYVGRPSKFGNPFADDERAESIRKYRKWILAQPDLVAAAKAELRGKNLVCWCAPDACHADVLLKIANS